MLAASSGVAQPRRLLSKETRREVVSPDLLVDWEPGYLGVGYKSKTMGSSSRGIWPLEPSSKLSQDCN